MTTLMSEPACPAKAGHRHGAIGKLMPWPKKANTGGDWTARSGHPRTLWNFR
jgi:hypothetical protein